jgi:hypothetical protein
VTALTKAERDAIDALAFRIRCAAEHLQVAPAPRTPLTAGSVGIDLWGITARLRNDYRRLEDVCPDLPPWPTTEEPT